MLETLETWDKELFIFLNNLGTPSFDGFWIFMTKIESWIPLFVFFLFLVLYYYKPRRGLMVFGFAVLTFLITLLLTNLTKDFIGRLRPNNIDELSGLIRVLQEPSSFSFFSGHASSSFAITTFVVLSLRKYTKWIYLGYLWPAFFVYSRIYVGVHFPSDLLVGALVGTCMAIGTYKISKLIADKE